MEDVLEIYHLPYDPKCPVICMDEQPIQLVKETRVPLPAKPGQPKSVDYEYERNGTANIFMFTEPLSGWRKTLPISASVATCFVFPLIAPCFQLHSVGFKSLLGVDRLGVNCLFSGGVFTHISGSVINILGVLPPRVHSRLCIYLGTNRTDKIRAKVITT